MRPATKITTPCILAILFLAAASAAFAARPRYVEERAYVGGFGLVSSVSSEKGMGFDGLSGVWGIHSSGLTIVSLVPKIKSNYGFGGLVGYRRGDYALEVSYWRSSHRAEYTDPSIGVVTFQDRALYHSFNVDLKRFLFTHLPAQPFVSGGLTFPWISIENASTISGTGYYSIASYSGFGFNLGVGLEFFALPNVTITGGAIRRWADYTNLRSADRQNTVIYLLDPNEPVGIRDSSFNFYAGATVDFI
jgi:opacity protein-like surface antigen